MGARGLTGDHRENREEEVIIRSGPSVHAEGNFYCPPFDGGSRKKMGTGNVGEYPIFESQETI